MSHGTFCLFAVGFFKCNFFCEQNLLNILKEIHFFWLKFFIFNSLKTYFFALEIQEKSFIKFQTTLFNMSPLKVFIHLSSTHKESSMATFYWEGATSAPFMMKILLFLFSSSFILIFFSLLHSLTLSALHCWIFYACSCFFMAFWLWMGVWKRGRGKKSICRTLSIQI